MNDIIVGIDGSPTALKAAHRAAEMAAKYDRPLHIVMATPVPVHQELMVLTEKMIIDSEAEAEAVLRSIAAELHLTTPATTAVIVGDPAAVLCEEARRLAASVVVVGNKRVQTAGRVLGTVAGHVSRMAPCDVLIVHTN